MPYDQRYPELTPLPTRATLGPDPEPLGTERFERLGRVARRRAAARPPSCPLVAAFGDRAPCSGGGCPFYFVPGVPAVCAVDHWSPDARRNPELATWYIARRTEAAGGIRPRDPVAIPLHTLPTPGPGN